MPAASIRLANEHDIDRLSQFYREFHDFHVRGVPDRLRGLALANAGERAEFYKTLEELLQRDDAAILVAQIEGELIGFAEIYLKRDEEHPLTMAYRYGYLQSLFVSVSYRRQGIGKQLMAAVRQWAGERGATEIQLDTWEFAEGPLYFYERLGYRTLKRRLVIDIT